jgi:capsular polysaccharide biosynthesis protein
LPTAGVFSGGVTAGEVYKALWRQRYFIALLTAVCVAAAWYATSRQDPTYEAKTLVRIQQPATDPGDTLAGLEASERLARTYAAMVDSGALDDQVAARAAGKASSASLSNLRLSGEPVEGLALLWISGRSADAAEAAVVANAASSTLRDLARRNSQPDEIVTLKAATTPSSAVEPNTRLNVALALLLALVFNCALVLLFEVLRDRLPESEELGKELGYPVLVTIPALHLRRVHDAGAPSDATLVTVGESQQGEPPPQRGMRRPSRWG